MECRKRCTLISEIFQERPWEKKSGSIDRSLSWDRIANILNLLDGFSVNQRSVRDRFNHLLTKYKQKRNMEERASGINPDHSEMDDHLEELDSLFTESEREKEEQNKMRREKADEDKTKALELRQQSLESFSETRKRLLEEDDEPRLPKRSKKKDVLAFLTDKNERETSLREKELEMKERELAIIT